MARAAATALLALTAACTSSGSNEDTAGTSPTVTGAGNGAAAATTVRSLSPAETDPGIDTRAGDHLVAVPARATSIGRLLVFFPGTGGRPDQYRSLITRAAQLGYHAVSLDYENARSINFQVCRNRPPGCLEAARLEILTGAESTYIEPDVDMTNTAFNRLTQLLVHERERHPDEGWDAYLTDGEPRWERIAVGGHSQGGGHAAMTARLHEVDRVLLFGATEPAPWTLEPFATPPERFWGLVHKQESNYNGITRSWENLALPGQPIEIELTPPQSPSHRLVTTVSECGGDDPTANGYYHNCYSAEPWMPPPTADGTPAFAPVWDHMLTGVNG
ncbi:MAG: BPSS1187 family protein [Acidimicrobiales bacterium]